MILNLVLFEIMLFISYIYFRIISRKLKFRRKEKTNNKHIKDIIDLMMYGSLIFILNGNIYFNHYYILSFFINLVIISKLAKITGL